MTVFRAIIAIVADLCGVVDVIFAVTSLTLFIRCIYKNSDVDTTSYWLATFLQTTLCSIILLASLSYWAEIIMLAFIIVLTGTIWKMPGPNSNSKHD